MIMLWCILIKGLWYNTTFEQRALDAKNVALAIQKFEFVDHENIYVIGHSQGGWIVQVALAEYPEIFAGGISMAGPSFGVRKQLVNDYQSKFICEKGLDENTALRKALGRVKREMFFISLFGIKGNLKQLKVIKNFEAEPYLKQIKKPFLMLFAENDALVNLKWSMDALGKMFPDGLPSHIQVYEAKGKPILLRLHPNALMQKKKVLTLKQQDNFYLIGFIQKIRKANCFY
jgi:pimeloyl-ACP methyl ester carboxylesterase